ncbi:hypothetical protein TVAG_287760 [Trichomonas vaginalis G3]|uniref:Uncharacterized protein n=1 Tax=Trichomonas vaginalis (strain ATCC PRA-98 / G3) TaxID=412133 RepID=A2ER43_TRIV3|nr:bifunctional inhibitor/lipid-transfer protein/seed storage 2s albumin superfamily protein family [Trichomonas vaginalis G3]EAY04862.1 hypothetical protein TVAG_287760 [Trichomonas vaginalis G3]KAI5495302.1 bifunctional inhibitor/lipid-transfer protein/seed storage 2s albumin superfamily protein family [Trichomonas vaginalis G3]|eukprot:XP_001317085.1 hypothetical protein [Trichomonas vaginalis G3]
MFLLATLVSSIEFLGRQKDSVWYIDGAFSDSTYFVYECQFHDCGIKEGKSTIHFEGDHADASITVYASIIENGKGWMGGGMRFQGNYHLNLMHNCIISCIVGGGQTGSIVYVNVNQGYNVTYLSTIKCGESNEPLSLYNFQSLTNSNISSATAYNYRFSKGTYGVVYLDSDLQGCDFSYCTVQGNKSPQTIIYFYKMSNRMDSKRCNVLNNTVDSYGVILSDDSDVHILEYYIYGNSRGSSQTYYAHNTFGYITVENCSADDSSYHNYLAYNSVVFVGTQVHLTKDEHKIMQHYGTYLCHADYPYPRMTGTFAATPVETVASTPHVTAIETPVETVFSTAHKTPFETMSSTPFVTAVVTPVETPFTTAFETPFITAYSTPFITNHITPVETPYKTAFETAHKTPFQSNGITPFNIPFNTAFETAFTTPFDTAFSTPFSTAFETPHSTLFSTAFETPHSTPFSTAFETAFSTPFNAAVETVFTTPFQTNGNTPFETVFQSAFETPFETQFSTPFSSAFETPYSTQSTTPFETAFSTPFSTAEMTPITPVQTPIVIPPTPKSEEKTPVPPTKESESGSSESSSKEVPNGSSTAGQQNDQNNTKSDKSKSKFNWIIIAVVCVVIAIIVAVAIYLYIRKHRDESDSDTYSQEFQVESAITIPTDAPSVTCDNPLFTTSITSLSDDPFRNDFEESGYVGFMHIEH